MSCVGVSFQWHVVKVGPGPRNSGPPSKFKSGTRDPSPLKFKSGAPGPPSKFKSRTPGPPSKFKSWTLIIIFLHSLIIPFPRIAGILSYILCSELIYHFCEVFNVTLSVHSLVGDGEIHTTCLASNLPDISWN